MTGEEAKRLSGQYRDQLLEIMEEWADHTLDLENGGFDVDFERDWTLRSHEKNIWAQARQTYMFAAVYQQADRNEKWLRVAEAGRDFLTKYAYAGGGRWNYRLSDDGKQVEQGTCSIFTDMFVLMALSQYAEASGDRRDLSLIEDTFHSIKNHIPDPEFRDLLPHIWRRGICWHSPYMIAINAVSVAGRILGRDKVKPFLSQCIEKVLYFFGENESGFLLESLKEDGKIWDTPEGRIVNPGHIFEGMAFCIDEFLRDGELGEDLARAVKMIRETAAISLDREFGGIFGAFDYKTPGRLQDVRDEETNKIDWVNCEALYASALAAVLGEDEKAEEDYRELHDYCERFFRPESGGDWSPLLGRSGNIIREDRGGKHRAAFHVPRALLRLSLLFAAFSNEKIEH